MTVLGPVRKPTKDKMSTGVGWGGGGPWSGHSVRMGRAVGAGAGDSREASCAVWPGGFRT